MPGKQKAETKIAPNASTGEQHPESRPAAGQRKSRAQSQHSANAAAKAPAAKRSAKGAAKATASRPARRGEIPTPGQTESDRFREAVARLAYHFWEVRSSQDGGPDGDWVRAEWAVREVLEKLSRST